MEPDMINATVINAHYYYPAYEQEMADKFFNAYHLETEENCAVVQISEFKDRKDRVCRFCHKKSPYVSFHKNAHVVSEMLGNKRFQSDFECDDCNAIFSRYENDLANYLGIVRTVQSVKGKKIPKFKSADKKLSAHVIKEDEITNVVEFRRFEGLNETFEFDKENKQTIVKYTKAPYTPLHVYKALLKMALSVVDPKHLPDYNFAFEFLRTKKHDEKFSGFAILIRSTMSLTFQFPSPTVMIFRKKDANAKLFSHIFLLYAQNSIFQIIMPFYLKDRAFYTPTSGPVDTIWCPPLFGNKSLSQIGPISSLSFNLNGTEKIYNEIESIKIQALGEDFEISKIINKETGEITERKFDGNKIIGIDLMMRQIE
ncbi:hypothetical protein [Mucilaginibacter sp. 10I4]|uniref:hypothetical protein n=1 Tax=Mucilaginibacter sp. 10I4 TaxID=3048580 RepID=UPI002B22A3B6|nr:hypothetical protein [Mucilaginibacter sp. 10I4]MEB0261779.1 hypothetical protein [Mucilaginibacter sp. 10I4]